MPNKRPRSEERWDAFAGGPGESDSEDAVAQQAFRMKKRRPNLKYIPDPGKQRSGFLADLENIERSKKLHPDQQRALAYLRSNESIPQTNQAFGTIVTAGHGSREDHDTHFRVMNKNKMKWNQLKDAARGIQLRDYTFDAIVDYRCSAGLKQRASSPPAQRLADTLGVPVTAFKVGVDKSSVEEEPKAPTGGPWGQSLERYQKTFNPRKLRLHR